MKRVYNRAQTDEVLRLLTDVGPMTTQEIARLTGRTGHGVRDSLRRLKADKSIHIERYTPSGWKGRRSPIYAIGDKPDAIEGCDTAKVRNARYRERMRQVIIARDAVRHSRSVNVWRGLM